MKLFLIFIVFFCCILIGVLIKNYYQKRQIFFCDLYSFCENLTNDISYNNEKLNLIIDKNIDFFSSDIVYLLTYFNRLLKCDISTCLFEKLVSQKLNYLTEKEKSEIVKFFVNIGTFSKEEELQKISNFMLLITPTKNEAIQKNKQFSNLYFKLFLFLGITFVIVFI